MIIPSSIKHLSTYHNKVSSFLKYNHHHSTKVINNKQYNVKLGYCSNSIIPWGRKAYSHISCNSSSNDNVVVTTDDSKSNEYLVQARIQARAEKRQRREKSLEEDRERNLKIKGLIYNDSATSQNYNDDKNMNGIEFVVPKLYAIRVSVDKELREELKMNGREKRGRVFIEEDSDGCTSIKGLKFELHSFFRCLKKSTYLLSAAMPQVLEDGSIYSPGSEDGGDYDDEDCNDDPYKDFIPIENDDDVHSLFQKATELFNSHNSNLADDAPNRLKRPSLLLHVRKDPNAPKPPPPPSYLENMPNPKDSETMTMLSFYSFPENEIVDPEEFSLFLKKIWKPFDALGRIYVAKEGVNAQMSIPTNVLANFRECCFQVPELGKYMENGINIDPVPLTMEQFAVAGEIDGRPVPPFRNLHIRVRQQIVADGLDKSLKWESAGYDMPPLEWHEKLKEARDKSKSQNGKDGKPGDVPLIFDCRNDYETSVGRFEGAIPLNTTNFRDSWKVLGEKLKDVPKESPIMTYCTGGIRCVKVGAYLTQELGFTNVSRLAGGIIAYDRTLNEVAPDEEPMFKGTNYVFDGRLGRQITDDALGECITCGAKTNLVTNCSNGNCHKRMVQCINCKKDFLGTCSNACKQRISNDVSSLTMESMKTTSNDKGIKHSDINEYSLAYSTAIPPLYNEIERNTQTFLGSGLHMLSDSTQGMLLKNLAAISREGRVLEIGSFTGYATARLLEGASAAAEVIDNNEEHVGSRESGAFVMSLERDQRAIDLAAFHIGTMEKFGLGEEGAKEASRLRNGDSLPSIEDESVSFTYKKAGCEIIRVSDALAFVEAISGGISDISIKPFDIVFIDADKTRFLKYIEACLVNDKVLKRGGIMIVDNVLWKGLVLDAAGSNEVNEDLRIHNDELKKSRRARKLATIVHNFNLSIVKDGRVDVLMLPIRDGLSVIRKK